MIGVVDVGGGMRGIYGAGVLDTCMEQGISFDYGIGVSAGAANIASYTADQKGRNYRFYTEFAFRKEYMSFGHLLKEGSYLDLDYIYGGLSNSDGEYPLDFPAMLSSGKTFRVVATNALNGKPVYFDMRQDMKQDDYAPIKASSCVPVVDRPYVIKGIPYFDGGISDPIPVDHAFSDGCEKVVLILTRPRDNYRKPGNDRRLAHFIRKRYPHAAEDLARRADIYNAGLNRAKELEAAGKLLILAPDDISGMKTLNRNREAMDVLYQKGRKDAERIGAFLKGQTVSETASVG